MQGMFNRGAVPRRCRVLAGCVDVVGWFQAPEAAL